jgi:multiple sugar transport system substrate-binding protein
MKRHLDKIVRFAVCFTLFLTGAAMVYAEEASLSFWTTEIEPKRMTIQQNLAKRFAQTTGITVEVVPVDESELPTRIVAAAAAGSLPDTVLVPLDYVITWTEEEILDPKPATSVINNLGVTTFAKGPLDLARAKGGWAGAPADGWGQLLLYRKDLFVGKDATRILNAPNTWGSILAATKALHDPPNVWGIAIGTDPTQVYTQQVFEQFALSNGARLISPTSGTVDLMTPEFLQALLFYKELAAFTPKGDIYWRQTREDYLGGRVAMIIWSPFILDEMAGLRDSVPVTASGLMKPLHELTGIVTAFQGPLGARPAQWGQVNYFGITVGADVDAVKWVEFLLKDGYLEWLSMAPEGQVPLRRQFVSGWKNLKIGVDRQVRISDIYSDAVISSIISGVERFDRWGFGTGKGACVGQVYGTKTLIRMLRRYLDGGMSAAAAAEEMTEAIGKLDGCP